MCMSRTVIAQVALAASVLILAVGANELDWQEKQLNDTCQLPDDADS